MRAMLDHKNLFSITFLPGVLHPASPVFWDYMQSDELKSIIYSGLFFDPKKRATLQTIYDKLSKTSDDDIDFETMKRHAR